MATERLISLDAIFKKLKDDLQDCKPVEVFDDCFTEYIKRVIPKLLQDVINYLENQPTVDAVEVVHGQWIEILSGQNSSGYECSICKRIVSVVSDMDLRERVLAKKYPYCHCGAKMNGGADNGL